MRNSPNDRLSAPDAATADGPVRRCILTGERAAQTHLVRLAIAPDGAVLPDVRGKAPGRGAWLGVDRDQLALAMAKGRLRGALARAFKGAALTVPDDLAERIERGLEAATLDRLGLEARSGTLLTGAEKIDAAARGGTVALLLHAADASDDGRRKRDQAWRVGMAREGSGDAGIVLPVGRERLSVALGRQNAVHAALIDERAAERVMHHLARWLHFTGCTSGAPSRLPAAAGPAGDSVSDDDKQGRPGPL